MKNRYKLILPLSVLLLTLNVGAQVNLNLNLVARYDFTGNANDLSVNANNGTPNGVTLRTDRATNNNASYEFDGVTDNIVVPASPSLSFASDRQSISFWFQLCEIPGPADGDEYYIMSKMTTPSSNGWHVFMRRDVATDGILRIYYRGVNNGSLATQNVMSCPINTVQAGEWHHVVFVVGQNNNQFLQAMLDNVYVDYVNKSSVIANNNLDLIIGGGVHTWSAADEYFGLGRLDDIRIYNRAINDQEIGALYNLIPLNTINPQVVLSQNNGLCLNNDSLVLSASPINGYTFDWTTPGGSQVSVNTLEIVNPDNTDAGVYSVVPNNEGCLLPALTITVNPGIADLTLTGPTQVCAGSAFNINAPLIAGAVYNWTAPGGGSAANNVWTVASATASEAGDYSVSYTLNGCLGESDTVNVTLVNQYTVTVFDTICQGQSIFVGGANQTTTGAYDDLYQSVTGCDSLVTTELFVKPLPQVSLGPDQQSCVGSTVTLAPITDGTLVSWSNGTNGPTLDVTTTGNYWFEAELDGCTARDTVTVSFFLNPAADFTPNDNTQCLTGNSFSFAPNNAYAPGTIFDWTFQGAGTPTSAQSNPTGIIWDASGTYAVTLTVTENNCVSAPSTLNVTVFDMPSVAFIANPQQGCEPVEVKFNNNTQGGTGPYQSTWILGDGSNSTDDSPVHTYLNDGSYNVTLSVVDANGCPGTLTQNGFITVFPQPVAGFSLAEYELTTTEPQLTVINESQQSQACLYYLNTGEAWTDCSFTDNIVGTGTYTITQVVTSGAGCIDSVSASFTIRPLPEVFVPNTFTPNGDYINEFFQPSISWIGDFEMLIYDRWGALVFETNDLFRYWNGKYYNNGTELPQGVYAYRIRYRPYSFDKNIFVNGSVSLIR